MDVKTPVEVAAVGDVVDVRILKVDTKKGRIALSMLLEGDRPKPEVKAEHLPQGERRPPRDDKRPRDQRDHKFEKPKPPERIGNTPRIVIDTRKKK